MSEPTQDRPAAVEQLRRRLEECATALRLRHLVDVDRAPEELAADYPNPADVLSLDVVHRVDVLLTYGGPTVWVELVFNEECDYVRGTWCTTDTPSSRLQRVELADDEAETLADAYCGGLDMVADTLRARLAN